MCNGLRRVAEAGLVRFGLGITRFSLPSEVYLRQTDWFGDEIACVTLRQSDCCEWHILDNDHS